jgi:chemotaxis protein histidine kinase CheA
MPLTVRVGYLPVLLVCESPEVDIEESQHTERMPRTTKNSNVNSNGCALGDCWSERELKAQVRLLKKQEAEEKAKVEAEAKADADEKAREKAAEEAEALKKAEAEEKLAKVEAEEKAKAEAEEKAKAEAEEKAKVEAEEKAKAEAEEKAKAEAEEKAKAEAEENPLQEGSVATDRVDAQASYATADEAADMEVTQITSIVVYKPNAERVLSPALTELASGGDPSDEDHAPEGAVEAVGSSSAAPVVTSQETPQMILYGIKAINNKRPILHVMDAKNDAAGLSSRKVKRAKWVSDNVPVSIRGVEQSMNHSLCALRDALNPGNACKGKKEGVNFKVHLCTNEEGPPQSVKRMIDTNQMQKFLTDA